VVAVHDVQDLIPDSLCIAASPYTPQHVSHPFLSSATCPPMSLCTSSKLVVTLRRYAVWSKNKKEKYSGQVPTPERQILCVAINRIIDKLLNSICTM